MRITEGDEVVFVAGVVELWHLPAKQGDSFNRRTLCGLSGPVWVYGPLARERRCCAVCRDRAPVGTFVKPAKARKRGPRRVPEITNAQVEVLYRLYTEKVIGVPAIGELVWKRLGFATPTSCSNAINRAFKENGLALRPRSESHRRSTDGKRLIGLGGANPGEQRLTGTILDELYQGYRAGLSVPELAELRAADYGYADPARFRGVVEYGWKVSGYKLRSNREAELLSRSKATRICIATTSGASGSRRKSCSQRAVDGSDYCFSHDPENAEAVARNMASMQARIQRAPSLEFAEILPYLGPLLVPRADRFGRHLEQASGALSRQTGVPGGVCSRLLNGRKPRISEATADKLLAPLGLSLEEIRSEAIAA